MLGLDLYFLKTNHENQDSEYIFYPYGPLGLGFIVNENIKNRFEELDKLYFFMLTISLLTIICFYNTVYVFNISITTLFFIGIILKSFINRLMVMKYNKSDLRISFKKRKRLLLKQHKPGQPIFFLIYIIILLYFSISFLLSSKHSGLTIFLEISATIYYILSLIDCFILLICTYFGSKEQ